MCVISSHRNQRSCCIVGIMCFPFQIGRWVAWVAAALQLNLVISMKIVIFVLLKKQVFLTKQ